MKRIIAPLAAIVLGLSALVSTPQPAEAGRGGRIGFGIAAGLIGGALLYHHLHRRDRYYYGGYYHRPYYAYHRPYYASWGPYYRPWPRRYYKVRYHYPRRHYWRHW